MKLYLFSRELLTFVQAKWIITKYATVGILLGIVILFGVREVNRSVEFAPEFRSTSTLAAENKFLQQQVNLISPRVFKLEVQATHLHERADNLFQIFQRAKVIRDTGSRFTNATGEFNRPSLLFATKREGR